MCSFTAYLIKLNFLMSEFYMADTNGIQVFVHPEYVNSQFDIRDNFYIWIYHIKISNKTKEAVQVMGRYWKIIDERGGVQEVTGDGVVGEQPVLAPDTMFQYSSGVHLRYPSGIMYGHYNIKKANGEIITIQIPAFSLDLPGNSIIH